MQLAKVVMVGVLFLGCREQLDKAHRFEKVTQVKVETNTCSEWQSEIFQKMRDEFPNDTPVDGGKDRIELDAIIGHCPVVLFRLTKDSLFLHSHKVMVSDRREISIQDSEYVTKFGDRNSPSIFLSQQSGESLWSKSKGLIDSIRAGGSKSIDEKIALDGFAIRVRYLSSHSDESWCTHEKLGKKESRYYFDLVNALLNFERSGFGKFIEAKCEM